MNSVLVGRQAVPGPDDRDGLVVGVDDHVLAAAVAERVRLAFPPRQVVLAVKVLGLEVGRLLTGGERFEPDELAVLGKDHRSGLDGAGARRGEQIAGSRAAGAMHGDRRRVQFGRGLKALHIARCGNRRQCGGGQDDRPRDREAARERHGQTRGAAPAGPHRDMLAGSEGPCGPEALALGRGVGAQAPAVVAAQRPDDGHRAERPGGGAQEADFARGHRRRGSGGG